MLYWELKEQVSFKRNWEQIWENAKKKKLKRFGSKSLVHTKNEDWNSRNSRKALSTEGFYIGTYSENKICSSHQGNGGKNKGTNTTWKSCSLIMNWRKRWSYLINYVTRESRPSVVITILKTQGVKNLKDTKQLVWLRVFQKFKQCY